MSYNIDTRTLSEIRREIRDNIIAVLEEARLGALSDVASIVYGDRTDVGNAESMPLIWILPTPHQPDLRSGHTTVHDFTFSFIAMVHDLDAETGKDTADDLAAQVYQVINEMRRSHKSIFFDVRPGTIDPSYEAASNTNVYWSSCEFAFRIQRRE